jgi:hypothetical protein
MLEDVIRENLQTIIESIGLIEERFEKINSADDFVSFDICTNHIPKLKTTVQRIIDTE